MQKLTNWVGVLGCGLVALMLGAGVLWNARAQEGPKPADKPAEKPADKKPQPPALPNLFDDFDDILKNLPDGIEKDHMKKVLEMQKQMLQQGFGPRGLQGFGGLGGGFGPGGPFGVLNFAQETRFGIQGGKPSETLVEQLDLPKGQGLVIEELLPDSAAAKAGLKPHDILLEVDGKPVSDDLREFKKALEDIKTDATVDVVVLRKGRKETIKGVKLPEAKAVQQALPGLPGVPGAPGAPGLPGVPGFGFGGRFGGGFGGNGGFNFQLPGGFGAGNMTMVQRNGDNFQIRQLEPGSILTVNGIVEQGKAKLSDVQLMEAGKPVQTFDSLDKVPDSHKERVKALLQSIEKGKIEQQNP
jgi:membrane-associated protease RseP (regulator of RpoE activity)